MPAPTPTPPDASILDDAADIINDIIKRESKDFSTEEKRKIDL